MLDAELRHTGHLLLGATTVVLSLPLRVLAGTLVYALTAAAAVGPLLAAFYIGLRLNDLVHPVLGTLVILGLTLLWCDTLIDVGRHLHPYALRLKRIERRWTAWEKGLLRRHHISDSTSSGHWNTGAGDGKTDSRR